jgi:hypothetical protein
LCPVCRNLRRLVNGPNAPYSGPRPLTDPHGRGSSRPRHPRSPFGVLTGFLKEAGDLVHRHTHAADYPFPAELADCGCAPWCRVPAQICPEVELRPPPHLADIPTIPPQWIPSLIIVAVAVVSVLAFLIPFVRAIVVLVGAALLAIFTAWLTRYWWPQPWPVGFIAALIAGIVIGGVGWARRIVNPPKAPSGAHTH